MSWTRLIRFVDDDDKEKFGEPCIENERELDELLSQNKLWAIELKGDSPVSIVERGDKVHVKALRDLVKPSDVPIVRCIGLNYVKHSKLLIFLV